MKKLTKTEKENWCKYKIPGCTPLHRVKIDVVKVQPQNSWKHEQAKCRYAHSLLKLGHKIITEAQDNRTGLIRDLVDLTEGQIYEFETTERRAKRFKNQKEVFVVELWEKK